MRFSKPIRFALLFSVAVLTACGSQPGRVERSPGQGGAPIDSGVPPPLSPPDVPAAQPAVPSLPVPPARSYPRNLQDSGASPAAISLVRQAQDARGAGHPDQARALLDRALRIEPRNPFVWQAMASVQMDLKDWEQVESAARKANSVARGNPYAELGNWKLIAAARQAAGDSAGAFSAQSHVDDATARIAAP